MSCNIVNEYVSYSKKSIKKYLQVILERYFDQDIYDDLINAYINTRYYNLYPKVNNRFEVNLTYYLKKSLESVKDDSRYRNKAYYMFYLFKYIYYFDSVLECSSVRSLIKEIDTFRKDTLNIQDEEFEIKLYNMLKDDLMAKKEFMDSFDSKSFSVNYRKVNKNQVFDCDLEHKLKFSKIYSDYAINKVFNNKDISEQKLLVLYPLVTIKILEDIIKGNFRKTYLVDYCLSLKDKPKKKKRILNIIDNDIVKEKIILKISYNDYINNKEEIYGLTKEGVKFALVVNKDTKITSDMLVLFKIFSYIITDSENVYNSLSKDYSVLYIPS